MLLDQTVTQRMAIFSFYRPTYIFCFFIQLDRCGLYEETINYIIKIEEDLHQLKIKRDRLLAMRSEKTTNKNIDLMVAVEIYDSEAIISITS